MAGRAQLMAGGLVGAALVLALAGCVDAGDLSITNAPTLRSNGATRSQ